MISIPNSLEYSAEIEWDGKSGGKVHVGDNQGSPVHEFSLDRPTEFGGKGKFVSPCALFFSSIGGCLLTTFLYTKERMRLKIKSLKVTVNAVVKLGANGYELIGVDAVFHVETANEADKARAQRCVEITKNSSFALRALQNGAPVHISQDITILKGAKN